MVILLRGRVQLDCRESEVFFFCSMSSIATLFLNRAK